MAAAFAHLSFAVDSGADDIGPPAATPPAVEYTRDGLDLQFSHSDVGYRDWPAGSVAIVGAGWRGPYTAFSSAGGGQLPVFEDGADDRYDVPQVLVETAFQCRRFSWQQEYHRKSVDDTLNGVVTDLEGGCAQFGTVPHAWWDAAPEPLEVAVRYASVDPDTAAPDDERRDSSRRRVSAALRARAAVSSEC